MKASFIIYYHEKRLDNLLQTLRLLCSRDAELVSKSELILVCQKGGPHEIITPFQSIKQFNFQQSVYNKPKMVNHGVANAQSPVIAIIDSDRILPVGYFDRAVARIQPKQCISTVLLYKIEHPCSDADIDAGRYQLVQDFRSTVNDMHCKNMFSGNTVMLREDYCGMDEQFAGYGYNDTDFTQTLQARGFEFIWLQEQELHLYHPLMHSWHDFIKSNVYNGLRYCAKWNLKPNKKLQAEMKELRVGKMI